MCNKIAKIGDFFDSILAKRAEINTIHDTAPSGPNKRKQPIIAKDVFTLVVCTIIRFPERET